VLSNPDVAGPWLPPERERRKLLETLAPRAHVEEGAAGSGPISEPGEVASVIRRITEPLRLESKA
jgi:hypothetical protein